MRRRTFVKYFTFLASVGSGLPRSFPFPTTDCSSDDITAAHIPRWRGFNLQGRFAWPGHPYDGSAFDEFDFATMAEWNFDVARLPPSY
jgi:hypothetical protein